MKLFSMVFNLNFYPKFIAVIAWSWLHSKLSTDSRPPLTHGFKQGVFFYKTETFLNPTNTEGAVNKKLNILVSFYHVSSSRFFFKVIQSHRLQSVFFKKTLVHSNNQSHSGSPCSAIISKATGLRHSKLIFCRLVCLRPLYFLLV